MKVLFASCNRLTSVTSVSSSSQHAAAHLTANDAVFELVVFEVPVALRVVDDVQLHFHQLVRRFAADCLSVTPTGGDGFGHIKLR